MTEHEMGTKLQDLLLDNEEGDAGLIEVATFEEAGLMTANKGLVVTMADGSEFQVQIVKVA